MAAAFMPAIARSVDLGKLPSPEVITKHLSPIVSSQRYDRDGYVAESLGPITLDQAAIGLAILSSVGTAARQQAATGFGSWAAFFDSHAATSDEQPTRPRHRKWERTAAWRAAPFRHSLEFQPRGNKEKCCSWAKMCYVSRLMAILKKNAFSRRVPDLVTEELVAVLSRRSSFEFKQLFDIVHENLRARNAASGGEEMLRLRAYEKLQNLVARGAVKKNGKKYKGLPSALASAIAQQNGHLAGVK